MAKMPAQRTPAVCLPLRLPLLAAALWTGLLRLGWPWPLFVPTLPVGHGPLTINGFLATPIGLERASPLGRRWAHAAPLTATAGTLLLALGSTLGALCVGAQRQKGSVH
ncbi:MAG: hypothetical protein R2867_00770 [Caldilineaceae bacterium]